MTTREKLWKTNSKLSCITHRLAHNDCSTPVSYTEFVKSLNNSVHKVVFFKLIQGYRG